mgnify:CR=1 FL=1
MQFRADKEQQLLSTGVQPLFATQTSDADPAADVPTSARLTTIRSVIARTETVIPPYSKLMVTGVFNARPDDFLPDGTSRDGTSRD